MSSLSSQEKMLEALEFFHYSQKYKDQLFTLVLGSHDFLQSILTDLRVLESSHIQVLICCRANRQLEDRLIHWLPRGYPFDYVRFENNAWQEAASSSLAHGRIPLLVFPNGEEKILPPSRFHTEALSAAQALSSRKVFFLSRRRGLVVDNVFLSHPSPAEVSRYLSEARKINIGAEALSFFHQAQKSFGTDMVLLQAKSGILFQEVFTHHGAGTLFSIHHQSICRQAELSDVRDIHLLMTPYIQSKTILPVSEDEVAAQITDYHLAVVNGEIVATAKLTDYGEASEIAKLSTLPRFRGRGRARELVRIMIDVAARQGKKRVFALSVDPKVAFFFRSLGFKETHRRSLPLAWQAHYDFSRPSRAFVLELGAKA